MFGGLCFIAMIQHTGVRCSRGDIIVVFGCSTTDTTIIVATTAIWGGIIAIVVGDIRRIQGAQVAIGNSLLLIEVLASG